MIFGGRAPPLDWTPTWTPDGLPATVLGLWISGLLDIWWGSFVDALMKPHGASWGLLEGSLGRLLGCLGASWGALVGLLGAFGTSWVPSWEEGLDMSVRCLSVRPLLEPACGPWRPSWNPLGPSWGSLGPSWGAHGGLLGCLGALLGRLGSLLRPRAPKKGNLS